MDIHFFSGRWIIYKRIIITTLAMVALLTGISYGLRIPRPRVITGTDQANLIAINENFDRLFEIANGRFNLNEVFTNPDGSLIGKKNDVVMLYTGGNYYLEVNVDGDTMWRGVALTDTP